jgi:DNA-binding CsgD family transcriptional regulator
VNSDPHRAHRTPEAIARGAADVHQGPRIRPAETTARLHALWNELADFGAHETDAAVDHLLRVLSGLAGAQRAFWLGAVRLGSDPDSLGGWRIRGIRRMDPTPEDDHVYRVSRRRLEQGSTDQVTLAQVREAGVFRARLLRELAPPGFLASRDYDVLYRSRGIHDAIFTAFPVNEDAESYFGWYRTGENGSPFSAFDRDLVAHALRALKWFHRRVMLHHGLLIAKAPLTPTERRLVSLLLTQRVEKEIARDLGLTLATTHGYITGLFRKFGVSGRSGLSALWLGRTP